MAYEACARILESLRGGMMIFLDDIIRPSWQCVHFLGDRQLAFTPADLTMRNVIYREVSTSSVGGVDQFLQRIATAFEFPDYFGANWDALLDECLTELSWIPAEGYCIAPDGNSLARAQRVSCVGYVRRGFAGGG